MVSNEIGTNIIFKKQFGLNYEIDQKYVGLKMKENNIDYKNGGLIFTKSAREVEDIIKVCEECGVSCNSGTIFETDADNIKRAFFIIVFINFKVLFWFYGLYIQMSKLMPKSELVES